MAVTYSSHTYTMPAAGNQLPLYGTPQQPSPSDSAPATPNNISPTSPRMQNYLQIQLPNQFRQLRPPKSPLYVPAALRPTERPQRQGPLTPPKSLPGSLDSLNESDLEAALAAERRTPLDMVLEHDWIGEEDLGAVTGPPTREHWKPDSASPTCDSPKCRSSFNLFVRKHHCRHCGHIFCSDHTSFTIPLNQEARFHPDGEQVRACEVCHRQYQKWDTARSLRRQNSQNSNDSGARSVPITPLASAVSKPNDSRSILSKQMAGQTSEAVSSSAPKDWAWSTF